MGTAQHPGWARRLLYLALMGVVFYSSYGLANWWAAQRHAQAPLPEIVFGWEAHLPFWAWTILPYWVLNLMYALAFFLAPDGPTLRRYISQLLAAQAVAVTCFVLWPLHISWAKPAADGLAGQLFASLAGFDQPFNQAPSLHIILALVVGHFYWRWLPPVWRLPLLGLLGLIALSVLTTYQHHFIDVPTGAWVGLWVLWALPYGRPSPLRRQGLHAKPAMLYAAGAILAAALALQGGGWLWLGWLAGALALLAWAYAGGGAAVFHKLPTGRLSFAASGLLWPYLLGARLNMALWLRGQPRSAAVQADVAIGSVLVARSFGAVLDVCAEWPCNRPPVHYASLPMLDMVAPLPVDLARAAQMLEHMRQRSSGPVLVCCALGYGRSTAVVLTWLLAYGGCPGLEHALAKLRRARPRAVLPPATRQAVLAALPLIR